LNPDTAELVEEQIDTRKRAKKAVFKKEVND
jgi:hypothetical protein